MKSNNNNRYNTLDMMRIIAAVLVVSLHVRTLPICGIVADVAKISVPFFLMCSGFFLYSNEDYLDKARVLNGIKKTMRLLIESVVFYLILDFILWHDVVRIQKGLMTFFSIDFWFFSDMPFAPVSWYLSAYIYSVIFIYLIYKYFGRKALYVLSVLGIVYWFVIGSYQSLFFTHQIGLRYSCCWINCYPFIVIGLLMKQYEEKVCKLITSIGPTKTITMIIIFVVISLYEHWFLKKVTGMPVNGTGFISTFIVVLLLFAYLLKYKNRGGVLSYIGKLYSMQVYIYHVAVNYILCRLFYTEGMFDMEPLITLPFNPIWLINFIVIPIFVITLTYIYYRIKLCILKIMF